MKVTTEELERCELLMTVEVEPKREEDLLKKAAARIARQVRIPGFRPGKAPYNVIVRRFGLEAVQQEALEQSIDKIVQDALEEAEVNPIAQIQLEGIEWDPLTVKVKVPTRPKVELSDYKEIRLESEPVEVSDEDVEEALENLREQSAIWVPVERPAKIGDIVTMSVVEKDGDEILAEEESAEYELVDYDEADESDEEQEEERQRPPIDLTTPLLGLSAGDEKTFTATYPETFGDERYAGKDITFEVEISSVKEKELDPLDDEFAKSVSDFETLDELKANIRETIRQQRDRQQKADLGEKALDEIIEASTIEWPVAFEEEMVEQELESFERRAKAYGLTLDSYLQMENKTKETFQEETRQRVVNQFKRSLVLNKVAEQENLKVGESEILERAKMISDASGYGDQIWRSILASQVQQNLIANDLVAEKALHWLGAVARGEDPASLRETDEREADEETGVEAVGPEAEESAADGQDETDVVASSTVTETGTEAEQEEQESAAQAEENEDETPAGQSAEEPAAAELKS